MSLRARSCEFESVELLRVRERGVATSERGGCVRLRAWSCCEFASVEYYEFESMKLLSNLEKDTIWSGPCRFRSTAEGRH